MRAIEWKTAIANLPLALGHPSWVLSFARGGRKSLLTSMVRDSIASVRQIDCPAKLGDLQAFRPVSALGKLGAPQELLYYITRLVRPRVCIETGVYRGLSTAFILAALHDNGAGKLVSIDLPSASYVDPHSSEVDASPLLPGEETGFAIPQELRGRWTLVIGDSRTMLPAVLTKERVIDFFYHDSEHTYATMKWEFQTAARNVVPGGLILSDDTQWNSAFADFCKSGSVAWSCTLMGRLGVARLVTNPT